MIRQLSLIAAIGALGACATTQDGPYEESEGSGGLCDAAQAAGYVGQTATAELGGEIRQATGATTFQWVPEGSAVTMDFRPDRVRVTYDRQMTVTKITCG